MINDTLKPGARVRISREPDRVGLLQRIDGDVFIVEPDGRPPGITERWTKNDCERAPPRGAFR